MVGCCLVAASSLALGACSDDTADSGTSSSSRAAAGPSGKFDPYAQTLEWKQCAAGECTKATVPIDYDDPDAGTTTIALARRQATGTDRLGTLFMNPGGPGVSGVRELAQFTGDAPKLRDAYDVVGFDPRGVGQSDPVRCVDDAALDKLRAADVDTDDPASVDAYTTMFRAQGEACLKKYPELARHLTTVEAAKDMDVLRVLVGDDQLNYMGFSYGTFLGATYAALFPDKVGRMVLDGPEDPSVNETDKALRVLGGIQVAFDDYAADCVANGCPLGASVPEVEQKVTDLLAAALNEPLATDDPERPLTRTLVFFGILAQLYSDASWPTLTDGLVAAVDGDGTDLLAAADEYLGRTPNGYPGNTQHVITPINCLDAQLSPSSPSTATRDDFVTASRMFGEIAYDSVTVGCDQWPIHPTVTAPDYTAKGAAPILVVATTGDPVTPIANARQLAAQLDSGVLLIRDGDGHTAYFQDNRCIIRTVDAYLLKDKAPRDGTECPAA